jgi:hypothetical protein
MMFEAILSGEEFPIDIEISVNMVDPTQIMIIVRKPAALLRYSRSNPIAVPINREPSNCKAVSKCISIVLIN